MISLLAAAIGLSILIVLNLSGVVRIAPYVLVGIAIWLAVLKSGVHATLAGVLIALTIPLKTSKPDAEQASPLKHLEHELHLWVAFMVLPIFAFCNAGVSLSGIALSDVVAPLPLGIALGLIVGKQVGIVSFCLLGTKIGLCKLPTGVTWKQVYGVACLCGIGFTMSLFIGTLAFSTPEHLNAVRLGVLMGSTVSAIIGFVYLRLQLPAAEKPAAEPA